MTGFYATLDIAAKFFKNRTHFNNSKRRALNEYQMLMSPAIQYNSFQRVHFLQKLSKSLINMTDFYTTLDFSVKFSRMELLKQRQISYQPNATTMIFKRICYADITNYPIKFFSTGTLFVNIIKIIDQHDRLQRYSKHCSKVYQESNALQQQQISHNVLQNTENAPNIDFNRIPRQNAHSHIILKLQSLNYCYDSMNLNVTIKAMISNSRNETAMIFKQICDAVITSYPINIFSMGTLFTNIIKTT